MLDTVEAVQLRHSRDTPARHKAALGQFFTPVSIARFMASLFEPAAARARLLDAGAGVGTLSAAFAEACATLGIGQLQIDAHERDPAVHDALARNLSAASAHVPRQFSITGGDFVETAVNRIQFGAAPRYTHAILNPPYKKIHGASAQRLLMRQVGLETVNLYAAFVGLSLELLEPGGQLVAIVPRSFCSGPYYRPFRRWLFERAALRRIHLFDSRVSAFKQDAVLQENVIIALRRGAAQGAVVVSHATDDAFADLVAAEFPFERVVSRDADQVIHVPGPAAQPAADARPRPGHTLAALGIEVSTGPVVDFRQKEHLCRQPEPGAVPLLYPGHFSAAGLIWPRPDYKKPNAIRVNAQTQRWLYPAGSYTVVRRLSSKEERRRVVAGVVDATAFAGVEQLGFENHLNVFHQNKRGLPLMLAHGLAAYLNSTIVDEAFRSFNGHTQVNASDLRRLDYPSRADLQTLGSWAAGFDAPPAQDAVDARLEGWLR